MAANCKSIETDLAGIYNWLVGCAEGFGWQKSTRISSRSIDVKKIKGAQVVSNAEVGQPDDVKTNRKGDERRLEIKPTSNKEIKVSL